MSNSRAQSALDAQLRRVAVLQREEERERLLGIDPDSIEIPDDPEGFAAFAEKERARHLKDTNWRGPYYQRTEEDLAMFEQDLPREWRLLQRQRLESSLSHRREWAKRMPARAVEAALVADVTDPAIVAVAKWNDENQNGGILVLSGPVGSGKTVAAVWLALRLPRLPIFVRASELAVASRYGGERNEWFDAMSLIVDDLGAEHVTEKGAFIADIDQLADTFYADRRHLVITTNATAKIFAERYGQRVADRLRESGTWIPVVGDSRRKKSDA